MKGIKNDLGKPRFGLIPVEPLKFVALAMNYGANKYGDYNWMNGLKFERYYSACLRHLTAWYNREEYDSESSLHHLSHAICCCFFLLYYSINYKKYCKFDDRPRR